MKKKILVLLLLLGSVFSFGFIPVYAQAEFVDDNTFVISNQDFDFNEEDVKEFIFIMNDYAETYDLFIEIDEMLAVDFANVSFDGFHIDFNADLPILDYNFVITKSINENYFIVGFTNYENDVIVLVTYNLSTDIIDINDIAIFDFSIVITLPEPEPEKLSIFGFFKNFYSNYIFPDDMLDTQTLNFISAITTLLFFIALISAIWGLFKGRKK